MNCEPDRHAPRLFCDIYSFEPGQEQKVHIHGEQDKVYLVLEGQGTFQVGSEKQVWALRRRRWRRPGKRTA
jgi:oxalate decarboxylase/phosphoglucose isomerase-like protein (cupin superfamily)